MAITALVPTAADASLIRFDGIAGLTPFGVVGRFAGG
jgi:hypothetical protein